MTAILQIAYWNAFLMEIVGHAGELWMHWVKSKSKQPIMSILD